MDRNPDNIKAKNASPDRERILFADLPPRDTVRWVSKRKAAVVVAVHAGVISLAEACHRYRLSVEEFSSWERAVAHHGVPGLRITHSQEYREPGERQPER